MFGKLDKCSTITYKEFPLPHREEILGLTHMWQKELQLSGGMPIKLLSQCGIRDI